MHAHVRAHYHWVLLGHLTAVSGKGLTKGFGLTFHEKSLAFVPQSVGVLKVYTV